ncbi:TetR/AcrR family transcriptional regulator [Nocardioides sp. AE5]|uniref:TetR/AcrR family transcriptional regulator n=1 Tax=Nocardioides sp. AE5 TaxID=2962573 RepID=UPI0028822923|nr:TetR/AcrR family transcriptional regulator [Nocardioides sp. AE5]MDT0202609.1 TetR/AcrR family transcriptional regulator [Nocardioides sp. AE5]
MADRETVVGGAPSSRRRVGQKLRKGDRRRNEILDAAEEQLRDRAALDLTIDGLAEAVGVSRSSLYFYFDSKWDVVDALVERASAEMFEQYLALPATAPLEDFLAGALEATYLGWKRHRVVFLAAAERSSHADEATDRWREIMERFIGFIADRIEVEFALDPTVDPTPLGGARRAVEIGCWMVERSFYMLFSREHDEAEEREMVAALTAAFERLLHPDSVSRRPRPRT